jgi:hypothetical protein
MLTFSGLLELSRRFHILPSTLERNSRIILNLELTEPAEDYVRSLELLAVLPLMPAITLKALTIQDAAVQKQLEQRITEQINISVRNLCEFLNDNGEISVAELPTTLLQRSLELLKYVEQFDTSTTVSQFCIYNHYKTLTESASLLRKQSLESNSALKSRRRL